MNPRIDPLLPQPKTNSEYDKLCKAYEKGRKAKEAGKPPTACPYPKDNGGRGQTERGAWVRGWLSGNRSAK